jgi:hypothetical protein
MEKNAHSSGATFDRCCRNRIVLDATDCHASMVFCVGEPYATRVTFKAGKPDLIFLSRCGSAEAAGQRIQSGLLCSLAEGRSRGLQTELPSF